MRLLMTLALFVSHASWASAAPVQAESVPLPARHFEVDVIGSGAPEVLVWFGAKEPSANELGKRRALAAELRADLEPGRGSFHIVVDLGPGEKTTPFGLDFPIVQTGVATRFQPTCLQRSDARALASYLVSAPSLAGVVELPPLRPGLASPTGGNLPSFLRIGLGLERRLPQVPAALPGETQAQATAGALVAVLDAARAGLAPVANAATHLGGDLWQFDLSLRAPQLVHVRPDPARTYPAVRLALSMAAWGDEIATPPAEGEAPLEAAPAEAPVLVELAWRAPGEEAFERLVVRRGTFAFPDGNLPAGAELRVVARVPISIEDVEFTLDAGRAGRAACTLALGMAKEPVPETPAE